jgi:hypothetical protein
MVIEDGWGYIDFSLICQWMPKLLYRFKTNTAGTLM